MVIIVNVIDIDINEKDDYIGKYNDDILNEDLYDYIYDRALYMDIDEPIVINISFDYKASKLEKDMIKKLIYEAFKSGINRDNIYMKLMTYKDLFLLLLGFVGLGLSFLFNYLNHIILSEVFMIIGWVSLWEIVERVLFIYKDEKNKKKKCLQLMNAEIKFN